MQNGNDPKIPAIMFDSQEMGCFQNPDLSFAGAAFSVFCTLKGKTFAEYQSGHGKMFIKPGKAIFLSNKVNFRLPQALTAATPILTTPHRLQNYLAVWGTVNNGGLFYHFDGFRYAPNVGAQVTKFAPLILASS